MIELQTLPPVVLQPTVHYIDTLEQLQLAIPVIVEYLRQPNAPLAVDTETYGPNKKAVPRPTRCAGGFNGYIRLLQLGFNPSETLAIRDQQYVIDVKAIGANWVAHLLGDILEKATVIGQNLKYEWQFLWVHMGIKLRKMRDMLLISQVLCAGDKLNHGLGDLYDRHLNRGWFEARTGMTFEMYQKYKATYQKIDWEIVELGELRDEDGTNALQYAADDVSLIFPLFDHLRDKVQDWVDHYERDMSAEMGMLHVIKKECALIPVFALMELRGIKLDARYHLHTVIEYLQKMRDIAVDNLGFKVTKTVRVISRWCTLKDRKEKITPKVQRVYFEVEKEEDLNLRSPQQLKPKINQMLSDALGEKIEIDTGEKEIREVLNRRAKELPPEVVTKLKWILQYKKASSLLSRYGQDLLDMAPDGYLFPSWHQIGTDESAVSSGRSSCTKPNMMFMPARGWLFVTKWDASGKPLDGVEAMPFFRRSFVAAPGWKLLCADYSQEEPRIAAEIYNEERLIGDFKKFGDKADVHSIFGKSFCGLDYYPPKGSFERDYIGKTGGLQLLYGAWWVAFKQFMYVNTDGRVDWTDEEAQQKYHNWFADYPAFLEQKNQAKRDAEEFAEDWKFTLAPCKINRQPFAVFWTSPWGRKRSFHLKPEHMKVPDLKLHKNFKAPVLNSDGQPELDANGKEVLSWKNIYRERISSAGREGFNHRIQGSAADVLKYACILVEAAFQAEGWDWQQGIVAVIHDEILCHVREENVERAAEIIKKSMLKAWYDYFKEVDMYLTVKSGDSWADCKS